MGGKATRADREIKVSELESEPEPVPAPGLAGNAPDRDEPIAQIIAPDRADLSGTERTVREGRIRPGTQDWTDLHVTALDRDVSIRESLDDVREDPSEVRRR